MALSIDEVISVRISIKRQIERNEEQILHCTHNEAILKFWQNENAILENALSKITIY
jgi:hypothetical protein